MSKVGDEKSYTKMAHEMHHLLKRKCLINILFLRLLGQPDFGSNYPTGVNDNLVGY